MGMLFTLLVLVAIGFSLHCRNQDGIQVSVAIFVASAATMIAFLLIGRDWQHFNGAIVLFDVALLVAFSVIAFRSSQRWPMIVCAMQFIVTASHVAGMIGDIPATRVLGVAQGLWAYIQCFAIISGVIHNSRRTISGQKSTPTS